MLSHSPVRESGTPGQQVFSNPSPQTLVLPGMLSQIRAPRRVLRIFAVCAFTLAVAVVAEAQSAITGKWSGTTRNGSQVVLDLKVADRKLTGTVTRDGQ